MLRYNNDIFLERMILSTGRGSHPQSVTIADVNHDHFLDIAAVNAWYNEMNVFLGFGDGSFDTRHIYSTGFASDPNSIAADDFNKDGRMSAAVINGNTSTVAVFLAFDYISFTNYVIDVRSDSAPYYVCTGDFNNDRLVDIAVTNYLAGNVDIYLGYGNGTFSHQMTYSTGRVSYPISLGVGDFDNDSHLDLVVANYGTGTIGVFLGYGNGSFGNVTTLSTGKRSGPVSVALGDFNRDKSIDIVVANRGSKTVGLFFGALVMVLSLRKRPSQIVLVLICKQPSSVM